MSEINKIKKRELVLPIAKKQVVVYPLSVGDDIALKTAIISPVKLDAEVMKLLWEHTDFWRSEEEIAEDESKKPKSRSKKQELAKTGGVYYKPKEPEFYSTLSYFDKLVLIWGIYLVTYGTLGEREITCSNEECGNKFMVDMDLEDTLHEDSLTIFDKDVPFTEYKVPYKVEYNKDFMLEFQTRIPSMADYNRLIRLIPVSEMQKNLENISNQFNLEQLMTLYTSNLAVYPKADPTQKEESNSPQEILSCLRDTINIDIGEKFMKEYLNNFSKYSVNFYKDIECPVCHKHTKVGVDLELELFRKQLSR